MGKKTNAKRKEFFAELAAKDKLRVKKKDPPKVKVAPTVKPEYPECCMVRYSNLPALFRPCNNCPKLATSVVRVDNTQAAS